MSDVRQSLIDKRYTEMVTFSHKDKETRARVINLKLRASWSQYEGEMPAPDDEFVPSLNVFAADEDDFEGYVEDDDEVEDEDDDLDDFDEDDFDDEEFEEEFEDELEEEDFDEDEDDFDEEDDEEEDEDDFDDLDDDDY